MKKKIPAKKPKKNLRFRRYLGVDLPGSLECKIFSGRNYETMEREIGDWLTEKNPRIRDSHLAQSAFVDSTAAFPEVVYKYTYLVIYRKQND